jgi:hypothetical protein
VGKLKKTREEAAAFRLLPSGNSGLNLAIPASRPGLRAGAAPDGLGTARFTKPLELKKRRSARCPAAREWRRWCSSTPQNHRPGQLAHIALGITWGGLVGDSDRGHRKGQLRVLVVQIIPI